MEGNAIKIAGREHSCQGMGTDYRTNVLCRIDVTCHDMSYTREFGYGKQLGDGHPTIIP
jgi:hypothetical protein